MPSLQELLAQQAHLERQIAEARKNDRAEAIANIRQIMADAGLSASEVLAAPRVRARAAGPAGEKRRVAAKYRNAQGDTWSGRGLKPRWLAAALAEGESLEDFAVE
jgi:DNA-binding protein H-NS